MTRCPGWSASPIRPGTTGVRTDATTDRTTGTATITDAFASATYSFDAYGRPTTVAGADGSAELITYDPAGKPVELLDAEGGLTVLGRDVAGKITSITSPLGAVTRYEYDACGRPWRTTDPTGAVTELGYDADQRVASRTLPTGEVETFTYDPCGRLVQRRVPGQGVSRYGYDACGRLTFSQDTWYGTRRFTYKTAGELTSTTNGVGGRTRFEYDTRGRLVRITDPLGGVTTRTYTHTDQVESVTDPLGRVTTATYDPAGRQLSQTDPDGHTTTSVDGRLLAAIDRDVLHRRVVITDHTGNDGLVVKHELAFNRRGQLTSRTRGGAGLSWAYDADGHRTSFTDAQGTTTTYTHDPAGRLTTVTNPLLGDAVFTHDASGRLTAVTAGNLVQEWTCRGGTLSEHSRTISSTRINSSASADTPDTVGETDVTLIGRDDDGRITALTRAGAITRYGYDGAGQMVSARRHPDQRLGRAGIDAGRQGGGSALGVGVRRRRTPDPGNYPGRVAGVRLRRRGTTARHHGRGRVPDGVRPRRPRPAHRLIKADGSWTEYAWGPTGHLTGTCNRTPDGEKISRQRLWVDALGELAGIDGTRLWWDTATPIPALTNITPSRDSTAGAGATGIADIGGGQVLSLPGGVTGIGDVWTASGWRAARPTDETDPWAVLGTPTISDPTTGGNPNGLAGAGSAALGAGAGLTGRLPAGVGLTGHGGVDIAGLEWLGARAYDPGTRGFLSADPLAPVLGAGWDGNPYAYAGNNPLNTTDPTGLRPLTDKELKAYDGSSRGALAAAGDWLGDNWEYVAGGAAIVGGAALMFVPGGQVVGAGLISFGADVVIQKATAGEVNWGQPSLPGWL